MNFNLFKSNKFKKKLYLIITSIIIIDYINL